MAGQPAVFDEKSIIGAAYRRIGRRVMGEQVEIPSFEDASGDAGMWSTLMRWIGVTQKEVA